MENFGFGIYVDQLKDEANYHQDYPKNNRKPATFGEEFGNKGDESGKKRGLIDTLEHIVYPVI